MLLMTISACASKAHITEGTQPRPYPYEAPALEAAEIQIFRDGPKITVASHTVKSFEDFDLWLNERFVRHIDRLEAGDLLELRLNEFINEHGEPFKGGGFFGASEPDPIVKAEIEMADGMIAIVAIPERGADLRN